MVEELKQRIQELIDTSGDEVRERVIAHYVKLETDRRTALIVDGMRKLVAAESDLTKIKFDHIIFDEHGVPVQQGYTAPQKGKRDKAVKLVDRLTKSLNDAIGIGNFKPLEETMKGDQKDDN